MLLPAMLAIMGMVAPEIAPARCIASAPKSSSRRMASLSHDMSPSGRCSMKPSSDMTSVKVAEGPWLHLLLLAPTAASRLR